MYSGQVENCKGLAEKRDCEVYYADSEDKTLALQNWLDGKKQVIIATNALRLEIDVPNIRLVLHAEPLFDLLNYKQESGRAGWNRGNSDISRLSTDSHEWQQQRRSSD